jgi:hypothetical protein
MSREAHVRFWEGVGVRFPCATHLPARLRECGRGQAATDELLHVLQFRPPSLLAGRDDTGHRILRQTADTERSMTLHQTINPERSITAGTSLKETEKLS